jgi:hypothetical protein
LPYLQNTKDTQTLVIAAVGAATIPFGFLIGVISVTGLNMLSEAFRKQPWDLAYSDETVDAIWAALRLPRNTKFDLQAVSTFDRTVLAKEVLDWQTRRLTSFMASINSVVSVALAYLSLQKFTSIHLARSWYFTIGTICVVLVAHAAFAWRQVRKMGHIQVALTRAKEARFE